MRITWWSAGGVVLLGLHLILMLLSSGFVYGSPFSDRPIVWAVSVQVLAGIVYLLAVWSIRRTPPSRGALVWAFAVGALLRALTIPSTPILEDDYHRYLWDGAVVARGINPYAFAPGAMLAEQQGIDRGVPQALGELAAESGPVLHRVNHPHLRSIYPPVAQAAFALAHWLAPWSLLGWRIVVLAFDGLALLLLTAILRRLKLPLLWAVAYWWNPVVVKELFNSAHMDVVVLPFVLGAILLAIQGRHVAGAGSLAFAVAAKVWPVVLLPLILRPIVADTRRLATAVLVFGLLILTLFLPMCAAGFGSDSGAMAYGRSWEMNDALFMVFVWFARSVLRVVSADPGRAQLLARVLVLAVFTAWTVWVVRPPAGDGADLCRRCVLVVAAVFLLSPTQFPWYYVWLAPLLAVRPRPSLLLLTPLLPLYYLRFHFAARGSAAVFDYGIVWLQFVPVWLLLAWEWRRTRRHLPVWLSEAGA